MIDLSNVNAYRESNRIEAKKSLGGLPKSIWETYSAFANAEGGVILLGVEEYKDRSLHPVDLPDPDALIQEFWEMVNDPARVSANILPTEGITWLEFEGKDVVAIEIPPAEAKDRPVYVGGDPYTGSYVRRGDGDYRCTREEIQQMLEAAKK